MPYDVSKRLLRGMWSLRVESPVPQLQLSMESSLRERCASADGVQLRAPLSKAGYFVSLKAPSSERRLNPRRKSQD